VIGVGTRASRLARAQTRQVTQALEEEGHETRTVTTDTLGDRQRSMPVHELGVAGAFTAGLERGLLAGEIDLAVHSLKDLPVGQPEGLELAAIPQRGPAADALLVTPDAHDPQPALPVTEGARVATSGPRRQSQLLAARGDLAIVNVRGNVDTRVAKLREGRFDALVTARVALDRMDLTLEDLVLHELDTDRFPPAPGQAAIAVQAREGSPAAQAARALDDEATRRAVDAERGVLAELGGGCGLALGAHLHPTDEGWQAHATFAGHAWTPAHAPEVTRWQGHGPDPDALAAQAAKRLAEACEARPRRPRLAETPCPEGEPVLVLASRPTARTWAAMLRERGTPAHPLATRTVTPADPEEAPSEALAEADWIVATSRQAAGPLAEALDEELDAYVAAVGPATARALQAAGLPCHLLAPEATGASLAQALAAVDDPGTALLAQGNRTHGDARAGLAEAGFDLATWQAYRTREREPDPEQLDVELPARAALVMSPASAETLTRLGPDRVAARHLAIGPSTRQALAEAGRQAQAPERPTPDAVAELIA
jgi:hydroxymethylbilane synthase